VFDIITATEEMRQVAPRPAVPLIYRRAADAGQADHERLSIPAIMIEAELEAA
jgi:hypothetical protein